MSEESIREAIESKIDEVDGVQTPSEPVVEEPQQVAEPAPPAEPVSEPEFDLGDGRKATLSEIKEWEQGNLRQSDYTKKTQEVAQQREEVKELLEMKEFLKKNPDKLQKVLKVLEEKEEAKQAEANPLEGLDPNDPYVRYFNSRFDAMKQQYQTVYDGLQSQIRQTQTEKAQQVLLDTLGEIKKKYEFADDAESEAWKQLILSDLKDNPKNFSTEQAFKDAIADSGKKYHDMLHRIGEEKIKRYLKTKQTPVPAATQAVAGTVLPKKPSIHNMQELFEVALDEAARDREQELKTQGR